MSNLSEIEKQIELMITAQVSKRTDSLHEYKNKFETLKFFIEDTLRDAEHLYENMKKEGLTVGSIEAEGYLRCAKTLVGHLKDTEAD